MRIGQTIQNQEQGIVLISNLGQDLIQVRIGKFRNSQDKTLVDSPFCHLLQGLLRSPRNGHLLLCCQILDFFYIFSTQIVLDIHFISCICDQCFCDGMNTVNNIVFFHETSITQLPYLVKHLE